MKQKYWIILISLLAAVLIIFGIVLSKRQQDQMSELLNRMDEMNGKMDELDVRAESMTAESKITNSAIKDADQRITALENAMGSTDSGNASDKDPVKLKWVLYSVPSKLA